jgi:hypothetical protein
MDRESQYYITNALSYSGNYPVQDALFNLIFRKHVTYTSVFQHFKEYPGNIIGCGKTQDVITYVLNNVTTPFTGAYLVPHRDKQYKTKVEGWLHIFSEYNFSNILELKTTEACFNYLRQIKGFGDFLACQFATELSWLDCTQFTPNEFVIPGNGAVRGLNRIGVLKQNYVSFLRSLADWQPITHPVWLPMTLMDYQNTFCEFDKYRRYLAIDGEDNGGRMRMKRKRVPNPNPITSFVYTQKLLNLK